MCGRIKRCINKKLSYTYKSLGHREGTHADSVLCVITVITIFKLFPLSTKELVFYGHMVRVTSLGGKIEYGGMDKHVKKFCYVDGVFLPLPIS